MNISEVVDHYRLADKRLLLLDYDGTLTPIVERPEDARPSDELLELLRILSADKKNTIVIISGRPHETLEEWLGSLAIEFVAEHSVWRRNKRGLWVMTIQPNENQIAMASMMLGNLGERHAGTLLEKKRIGIALHYRHAPTLDDSMITRWIQENAPLIQKNGLTTIHGKSIIELVPDGVDKGTASMHWLRKKDGEKDWDFILAAGDDTTDESMFNVLPLSAISIRVGEGNTKARITVAAQSEFMDMIQAISTN